MNRNSPDYYVETSTEASLSDDRELIAYIRALPQPPTVSNHEPRVQPIITPRFAISCTDDLLSELGSLAASEPDVRIQTHISENPSEVAYTQELFPSAPNYAGVYDMFGLLRHNTILAHAVHLSQDEMELIRAKEAGISHCPTSNFNLSSGIAPVGVFLDMGIKVIGINLMSFGVTQAILAVQRSA
jgi:guanine deaminase